MNKKVKEKYKISFAEIAVSSKGNNKFLETVDYIIDWGSIERPLQKYSLFT